MSVRVLLIDDDQDQAMIVKNLLAKAEGSFQVEAACSAKEGLEKLSTGQFDIALCDYRLPDMSGLEVLKALTQQGSDCPVVIMTSVGNEQIAVEALKLGAYDYVVKDVLFDKMLLEVIRQSLERHGEKNGRERLEVERNEAVKTLEKEKEQLKKINLIMVGREERILELKHEVNALLNELGRRPHYHV